MLNWHQILNKEFEKEYFKNISNVLKEETKSYEIFPPKNYIFNIFNICPLDKIKAVILGQDCYHQPGQAHGLSFSVKPGIKIPPSLRNIYKELKADLNIEPPNHGYLKTWAEQGVFLLNCALTVRKGEPGSHLELWKPFTDNIIKIISEQERPIVYMLWGSFAQGKKHLINNRKSLILTAAHPSPFSAHNGFFGCKHFSKANNYLVNNEIEPINWEIK